MLRAAPALTRSLFARGAGARVPVQMQTSSLHRAQSSAEAPAGGCPLAGGYGTKSDREISDQMLDMHQKCTAPYSKYLQLEKVLTAQKPASQPEVHDEMLFIVMHQTKELWLKLIGHEMLAAINALKNDEVHKVSKILSRVKTILNVMHQQWPVLATMTPDDYNAFRPALGSASGFQSAGYRALEFILGNKSPAMMVYFKDDPDTTEHLQAFLEMPSIYDEFLAYLNRQGLTIPAEVLNRDVTVAWQSHPAVVQALKDLYDNKENHWNAYDIAEKFVDIDESIATWRFRHLTTVSRFIGYKEGTGGSHGIGFLDKVTKVRHFPELWEVRSRLH